MNDKVVFRLVAAVSILVFSVIVILQSKMVTIFPDKASIPEWVFSLPKLNAIINGTCTVLLCISLYFIKRKNIEAHKRLNLLTFFLSSLFLVSYIIFHATGIKTTYGGQGTLR